MRESNPHQKFWRLLSYHLTNPLNTIKRGVFTQLNLLSLIKIREPPRTKFMPRLQLAFIKLLSAYLQNYTQVNLFFISFHLFFYSYHLWLCPRPISNSQLHALLHFHLRPINQIVFLGPYSIRMRDLISGGVSRLDAFSVYLVHT